MRTKSLIQKFIITFFISFTFVLLFRLEANLVDVIIVGILTAASNLLATQRILRSKEKVVVHLYAIIIFVLNMILVNIYSLIRTGYGVSDQSIVFYLSITITIILTISDFYKPERNV